MRREALDRERPGDAHAARIGVGLVVEILDIGRTGDRGVDCLLPGDARVLPRLVAVFSLLLKKLKPAAPSGAQGNA